MSKPKQTYFMESDQEGSRLKIKGNAETTAEQLVSTGLLRLPNNANVVDAGSGVGFVSAVMAKLIDENQLTCQINLVDQSDLRLQQAKNDLRPLQTANVKFQYISSDLNNISLPSNFGDYVFSRFVFEYLATPEEVFAELYRITKVGGKMVVGDLDYNGLTHYPLEPLLERKLAVVMDQLRNLKLLDPYAGRKIYSYFHKHKLKDVKIQVIPHHLFYGKLTSADQFNWDAKFNQLISYQSEGILKFDFDVKDFKHKFMKFLKSEERFTYTPLILVEGVK